MGGFHAHCHDQHVLCHLGQRGGGVHPVRTAAHGRDRAGRVHTLLVSRGAVRDAAQGMPSSFALELPPYRRPQVAKVIVRSIFDRTLFVLGRAVAVAAPADLWIWLYGQRAGRRGKPVDLHCTSFLDPLGRWMGLDGVILMAFVLGFPPTRSSCAHHPDELPVHGSSMMEMSSLTQLHLLLVQNGWTWVTALCMMLFSLMHFPCGTTCWTIQGDQERQVDGHHSGIADCDRHGGLHGRGRRRQAAAIAAVRVRKWKTHPMGRRRAGLLCNL